MSERGFSMRRDGVGILLFTVGAFFAVLLLKALASDVPAGQTVGTAALAQMWIDSLGWTASLLFTAGIAAIGARMFLTDTAARTAAAAGLLAIAAIAVATLFGAFSPTAGGRIGDAIGGSVGRMLHPAVGALVGLALLALPFAGALRRRLEHGDAAPFADRETAEDEVDGVTAAEAAALLPDDRNRATLEARKQARPLTWSPPPSPYPEDVRRRGEIPAGAKPLEPVHAATANPVANPSEGAALHRWTTPRTEEPADTAGEDLVALRDDDLDEPVDVVREPDVDELDDDTDDVGVVEPSPELVARLDPEDEFEIDELPVVELRAPAAANVASVDEEELELLAAAEYLITPAAPPVRDSAQPERVETQPLAAVPTPSWEQPSLFVEEEEPVDAYGTPLSLVESIREEVVVPDVASTTIVEDEEVDEEEALEDDDEYEDEEEETEDELDEEEGDEDGEYEDEEGELEDDEEEWDEEEDDDESEEDAEESEELEVVAEDGARVEPEEEPAMRAVAPTIAAKETVAAAREPELTDVVLTPQATSGLERRKLLSEAGCLFVERGRVAVSMLQREYGMDFDEACKVLDEMQNLGLIGPYLGGQRRDILLTREQWLEKVESA